MNPSPTFWARFVLLMLLAHTLLVDATPLPWSINRYQHTAFTKRDGAPTEGRWLAQTADGYLWAADVKGLTRYDGVAFRPFVPVAGEHLLGEDARELFAPRSGGLWFAYEDSPGISFVDHGHITNYETNNGWRDASYAQFFEDRTGDVLAFTHPGMFKLANVYWKERDQTDLEKQIHELAQDNAFDLWAVTYDGRVLIRHDGMSRFEDTGTTVEGAYVISTDGKSSIFVSSRSPRAIHRFRSREGKLVELDPPIPLYARYVTVDLQGNVWVATASDGVHFLGPSRSLAMGGPLVVDEKLNKSTGLTGNYSHAHVDRSGNVWIFTDGGLDRFTPSAFSQVAPSLPAGITMISFTPGADTDVWIGSETENVIHYVNDKPQQTLVPKAALATYTDKARERVYAATDRQLWQLAPGPPTMLADTETQGIGNVLSIASDKDGLPWLATRKQGVASWDGTTWQKHEAIGIPIALVTDSSGILWAGYTGNHIASFDGASFHSYTAADGITAGAIKTFAFRDGRVWFGGNRGVQSFDGTRFTTLRLDGEASIADVGGIAFDRRGNLWIHYVDGLMRVPADALSHVISDAAFRAPYRLFDADDGLLGIPAQSHTLPTIVLGNDGRLWISSQTKAAWLSPDELPAQLPAPQPIIERVSDGAHDFALRLAVQNMPSEVRDLSIEYAAPELTFPSRVRFQYRLEGVDRDWQDVGKRRQVSYGRLPSGPFTFRVRSSMGGNEWKEAATPFQFVIAPAYYERWWFRALVLAAALLVGFVLVRSAMNLASAGARRRMQIRSDEREAVARDIHDTLLQTTQALLLRLTMLGDGVADETTKKNIADLALSTREAIVEGRGKVKFLRTQTLSDSDAISRLIRTAASLSVQHEIAFHTKVAGHPRRLSEPATEELVPILSEALNNAFVHAKAKTVTLSLAFGFWKFVATVLDDGIGIDEAIVHRGAPEGHWGIRGAVERTKRIGGRLRIEKRRPQGTKVEVSVPVHRAYVQPWQRTKGYGAAATGEQKQENRITGEADT